MAKILIVDDNQDDLETTKAVLEKEGHDIMTENDGAAAIDVLKSFEPELIMIDIQMPTLSGYDLLRLIRERLKQDVKMVYVSIVPESDVDMTDVDGFIQKPFSPDSLLTKVREVL